MTCIFRQMNCVANFQFRPKRKTRKKVAWEKSENVPLKRKIPYFSKADFSDGKSRFVLSVSGHPLIHFPFSGNWPSISFLEYPKLWDWLSSVMISGRPLKIKCAKLSENWAFLNSEVLHHQHSVWKSQKKSHST